MAIRISTRSGSGVLCSALFAIKFDNDSCTFLLSITLEKQFVIFTLCFLEIKAKGPSIKHKFNSLRGYEFAIVRLSLYPHRKRWPHTGATIVGESLPIVTVFGMPIFIGYLDHRKEVSLTGILWNHESNGRPSSGSPGSSDYVDIIRRSVGCRYCKRCSKEKQVTESDVHFSGLTSESSHALWASDENMIDDQASESTSNSRGVSALAATICSGYAKPIRTCETPSDL